MANNDNAMARFLFAILQQKCLKDVDWNEVARNPVLTQEITNGHAARMRFSRFRQQVLGLQPQKRNRTTAGSKSRVTKKKKEDDHPKPKKEDEDETKSGSGIGNIKSEITAIKSERKSIDQHPNQPAAPMMATPDMKTEATIANPFSQHLRHPSILSVGSPSIKKERLPSTGNANTGTPSMPEPSPFGILTTTPATSSTSSTPYIDNNHHRMQMRLLTPTSDTDGMSGTQGFLPHSPCPSTADLLQHSHHNHSQYHNQHHHSQQQQHQHQNALVGAGSPPLSASAPSPYDFSQHHQHGCDTTTTGGSAPATDSSSPWHSQHHHHQHNAHHSQQSQSQSQSHMYTHPAFGLGIVAGNGFAGLDYNNTNPTNNPFCSEHHHLSHQHHHQDEDAHHDMVDSLGLHQHHHHGHHSHHHHHDAAAAAAAMEGSMFRERELELEMGAIGVGVGVGVGAGVGSQVVKGEWDGEEFGI